MSSDHGSRAGKPGRNPDEQPTCRWQESLALHAQGSLSPTEIPGLIDHLATGCPTCVAERARVEETLAIMDACEAQDAATVPTPSASLRVRLLQSVAHAGPKRVDRNWQQWKAAPGQSLGLGLSTVRAGAEGFERTSFEGIEVKPLHVDTPMRRVTMLVKMAPGTSYPAHRHATSEECFVVSGEIKVGDRTLNAGDYQVAARGSLHPVQSTEKGCVLFIVSSQDDELL